jgi:lysyl endopeptidase
MVQGQISRPGRPYLLEYSGSPGLKVYDLVVTKEQKIKALTIDQDSMLKSSKSGLLIDVFYTPENSGTWDTLADGTKIWRAAFRINGASMMNLIFSPYQLNRGVRIFLFDSKQQTVLGAFSDLNNKPVSILATAQIPGDFLIVEVQVPRYLESLGSLAISGVGCDFSGDSKTSLLKDGWFGASGDCNVDIQCDHDSLVNLQKKAVVRIVFNGNVRCTGTLVNNTKFDGINYVLTAEHCISEEVEANSAVFYFDYESPWCNGPNGNDQKSLSGSTIRATGDKLDFTLLELLEPIPFTYQPYYAGWDYSGNQPASGYCIHHPMGDVKKIAYENHPLKIGSYGIGYNLNTHWVVQHWETGTTEKGSSGAAFFDQYSRIVGTLTGGYANCTHSVNDYFQMFSHSWDDYSSRTSQLACWLDPSDLDNGFLVGFDPYADFRLTGDTLSNILTDELLTTETGTLSWGSYSGHNSAFLTGFAERFEIAAGIKMPGILLHVADNYVANASATIVIKVWKDANGPGPTLYEKSFPLADLAGDTLNFIEFDSIVSVGAPFFAGYELEYNIPQDTFSTYMAADRLSDPFNTAYVFDGYNWQSLASYTGGAVNSSFAIMPVVYASIPEQKPIREFDEHIIAYPNPASSSIRIEFREISVSTVQVALFNMQGQLLLEKNFGPYQRYIDIEPLNFSNGVYLMKVKDGKLVYNLKISIIK